MSKTPRLTSFNVNEKVSVQLTKRGREIYRDFLLELNIPARPRTKDSLGYSEWQLWELMQVFGRHMGLGMSLCFETTILIHGYI